MSSSRMVSTLFNNTLNRARQTFLLGQQAQDALTKSCYFHSACLGYQTAIIHAEKNAAQQSHLLSLSCSFLQSAEELALLSLTKAAKHNERIKSTLRCVLERFNELTRDQQQVVIQFLRCSQMLQANPANTIQLIPLDQVNLLDAIKTLTERSQSKATKRSLDEQENIAETERPAKRAKSVSPINLYAPPLNLKKFYPAYAFVAKPEITHAPFEWPAAPASAPKP